MQRFSSVRRHAIDTLDADAAFIAVLIAAINASGHISADEAERAHNVIWSTRRFRGRSGDAVGRKIARVRGLLEMHGTSSVMYSAARALSRPLRQTAYALAADLVLVDGRMERPERRFLARLADDLGLEPARARTILEVLRLKNRA